MRRSVSWIGWALVCALIVFGSLGEWAPDHPGVWAPTLISFADVAQNVLIYVPFGMFGVLSLRDRYPRHWLRLVVRIVGLAILFSASNEALQLYTLDRVASLIDIVSAVIGAAVGGVAVSAGRPK